MIQSLRFITKNAEEGYVTNHFQEHDEKVFCFSAFGAKKSKREVL